MVRVSCEVNDFKLIVFSATISRKSVSTGHTRLPHLWTAFDTKLNELACVG